MFRLTFENERFAGTTLRAEGDVEVVAFPESDTTVGAGVASLTNERLPFSGPVAVGAKRTLKLAV